MDSGKLHQNSQVYTDSPNPHKDIFNLYWDNDVVMLSRQDAKALIDKLNIWLQETH